MNVSKPPCAFLGVCLSVSSQGDHSWLFASRFPQDFQIALAALQPHQPGLEAR